MDSTPAHQIVLVGPTHPYTGGIAQHTTRLALELEKQGATVTVESWKAQYPRLLYKGPERVPGDAPEIGIPTHVSEKLAWYSPWSWWQAGRRSRGATLGLNIPTPFHAIPYRVLLMAAGKKTRSIAIVHNVLPHESGPLDRVLMGALLRRCDTVVVHNREAESTASQLGVNPQQIEVRSLPSPWPATSDSPSKPRAASSPIRLLFFGTIRPYKGLDVLLDALHKTPDLTLTIAGEFWEDRGRYQQQIEALGLSDRVQIRAGYVAESEFSEIFTSADVLVLPYRSGTGSIVRELGFRFGLPVIATSVGSIAEGIDSGVNGLVVEPNDVDSLVDALTTAADPATVKKWRAAVVSQGERQQAVWDAYTHLFSSTPALGSRPTGG